MPEASLRCGPQIEVVATPVLDDDLSRQVYVVLGIPIDAIDMTGVVRKIEAAAARRTPLLISTANINFVVTSQTDAVFKEALLRSDLCTADGVPVVWISRLLGIPIAEKVAGSDLFARITSAHGLTQKLKLFLFGGVEGAAAAAGEKLNTTLSKVSCAGSYYPGFGPVSEMSTQAIIDTINSSNADFLVVALGAKKGQEWLLRNHDRLHIPVRAHLGTVINIQAGTVKRAPGWMQKSGLEWLWRIGQEPQLWQRYAHDGLVLIRLMLTRVLPLVALTQWHRLRFSGRPSLTVTCSEDAKSVTINLNGFAQAETLPEALPHVRYAADSAKAVVINFSKTKLIDARFLGLLLMLDKTLNAERRRLSFRGVPPHIGRIFRLNGFEHLDRA